MNVRLLKLWLHKSAALLWGTLLYNAFMVFLMRPLLRKWFPPLNGWERVGKFFTGTSRLTYSEILPYAGPAVWIAGNALFFALLHRELSDARHTLDGADGKPAVRKQD